MLKQKVPLLVFRLVVMLSNSQVSIDAIFYSRFQDIEGYTICASDPPGVLGDDQFKQIGYYFLPDKSLSDHVIVLHLDKYRLFGCPVYLSGSQYAR